MHASDTWEAIRARFDRLGAAIAAELNAAGVEGGGWTHAADLNAYGSVALEHPRGWRLWAAHLNRSRKGAAGQRLTIQGRYPHSYNGDRAPDITVSLTRPPRGIAADIAKRFLPEYLVTACKAAEEERQAQEYARARAALNRRIREALPAVTPAAADSSPSRKVSVFYGGTTDGRPRAHAGGKVRLSPSASHGDVDLRSVPADLLVQLLELVNAQPALTGRIVPQAIEPARPELTAPVRTIVGAVIDRAFATPAEPEPVAVEKPSSTVPDGRLF